MLPRDVHNTTKEGERGRERERDELVSQLRNLQRSPASLLVFLTPALTREVKGSQVSEGGKASEKHHHFEGPLLLCSSPLKPFDFRLPLSASHFLMAPQGRKTPSSVHKPRTCTL